MKYLSVMHSEDANARGPEESLAGVGYVACDKGFHGCEPLFAEEALQPVRTSTTLYARNGRSSFTDGPFVETKE